MVSSSSASFATSDLHQFDLMYNLPEPTGFFTKVDENGGTNYPTAATPDPINGSWATEISLDVEWAHAISPGAKIILIEVDPNSDLTIPLIYAKSSGAQVVSMSFGSGSEFDGETAYDSYFSSPAGYGITWLAASGDYGAPSDYPTNSPNVVSVGGTTLNITPSGTYVSETGWEGSGGGISLYESQPSYQQGLVIHDGTSVISANGMRATPDVSFDADPNTGVPVYDSYDFGSATPWLQVGGTSFSCPAWASLVAIADEIRANHGLTSLDGASQTLPYLYDIYTNKSSDFYDITSGTSLGTPNYTAGTGYDLVTGIGTPKANLVVYDLANVPLTVASSTPANGAVVTTPPTSFVIQFSEAVSASSLQASDLKVNSIAANSVILSADGLTATFAYTISPVTSSGPQTMTMTAGAVAKLDGLGVNTAFTATFTYQAAGTAFMVTNTNDSGAGSLRQAILDANAHANNTVPDEIDFDIPGSGVQTIQLLSSLPVINDPVIINGYSEPGASANTLTTGDNAVLLIELDGSSAGAVDGLAITVGGCAIEGLVIDDFAENGIAISDGSGNIIAGNFIGTDPSGTVALGNGGDGILIDNSAGALVAGNLIAANTGNGLTITGGSAVGTIVENNFIGTDATAAANLGNTGAGVWIANGASANQIGGSAAQANTIAYNQGAGVVVTDAASVNNSIQANSIYSNTLGIDLLNGGNLSQNSPVLTAVTSGPTTQISGSLTSTANATFTINFYANASADSAGNVEGERYLGSATVSTGATGVASFNVTLSTTIATSELITATATDPNGNTSEFSPAAAVASPLTVTINQAAGQPDPTNAATINFTVVFSEVVTDFHSSDVDLSASTAAGTLVAVVTGSGATYNVVVSGMTGEGYVIASIDAGVVHDAAGNANSASTSTDNSVYYNTPPTISSVVVVVSQGLMTWNLQDANGIGSTGLTVDGVAVSAIYGPYAAPSGVNYAGVFGSLASGRHSYTITATDTLGLSSQYTGMFDVGPTISSVVVATTASPPVITCRITTSTGVASTTIAVDGTYLAVAGPYGTKYAGNYAGLLGALLGRQPQLPDRGHRRQRRLEHL